MRAFLICVLVVIITGCTSKTLESTDNDGIVGDYTFSRDSRHAGEALQIQAKGDGLLIILEGKRMDLKPEGGHFRFTSGDEVWNKDQTAKVLELFTIVYDSNRQQFYMGQPDAPNWRQYLIKK